MSFWRARILRKAWHFSLLQHDQGLLVLGFKVISLFLRQRAFYSNTTSRQVAFTFYISCSSLPAISHTTTPSCNYCSLSSHSINYPAVQISGKSRVSSACIVIIVPRLYVNEGFSVLEARLEQADLLKKVSFHTLSFHL
jgi:hypothetical protein